MGKNKSSNDNRSNSKNPNNPTSKATRDNRSNQLNPNNLKSQGKSRKK